MDRLSDRYPLFISRGLYHWPCKWPDPLFKFIFRHTRYSYENSPMRQSDFGKTLGHWNTVSHILARGLGEEASKPRRWPCQIAGTMLSKPINQDSSS
jgi:hypothetical protein